MGDFLTIGVIAAKTKIDNPWIDHRWSVGGLLTEIPPVAPHTLLRRDGATEFYFVGTTELPLHAGETAHYRDNLAAEPKVWVVLRPHDEHGIELIAASCDPYEGEAFAETIGDIVEPVPMPEPIEAALRQFYEAHHVEREFFKRTRKEVDNEALGRRNLVKDER
jgi:hypothetical protein